MKKRTRSDVAPYGTWKCNECNIVFRTRAELRLHNKEKHVNNGKRLPWNKGLTKETSASVAKSAETYKLRCKTGEIIPVWKNKHLPEEVCKKVSNGLKRAIAEGRANGWKVRSIESYPEKFWKLVLDNYNIEYEFNFKVNFSELNLTKGGCYFLDFKLPKNVDLEIDGSLHQYRIESDIKRDKLISSIGYKVYRIAWNDINSNVGKLLMKTKIEDFLYWYNNL